MGKGMTYRIIATQPINPEPNYVTYKWVYSKLNCTNYL